jgi:hypothetical protein
MTPFMPVLVSTGGNECMLIAIDALNVCEEVCVHSNTTVRMQMSDFEHEEWLSFVIDQLKNRHGYLSLL